MSGIADYRPGKRRIAIAPSANSVHRKIKSTRIQVKPCCNSNPNRSRCNYPDSIRIPLPPQLRPDLIAIRFRCKPEGRELGHSSGLNSFLDLTEVDFPLGFVANMQLDCGWRRVRIKLKCARQISTGLALAWDWPGWRAWAQWESELANNVQNDWRRNIVYSKKSQTVDSHAGPSRLFYKRPSLPVYCVF